METALKQHPMILQKLENLSVRTPSRTPAQHCIYTLGFAVLPTKPVTAPEKDMTMAAPRLIGSL